MTELQTLAYILGGAIFVMALVILGLAATIAEMKKRLNVLWRSKVANASAAICAQADRELMAELASTGLVRISEDEYTLLKDRPADEIRQYLATRRSGTSK